MLVVQPHSKLVAYPLRDLAPSLTNGMEAGLRAFEMVAYAGRSGLTVEVAPDPMAEIEWMDCGDMKEVCGWDILGQKF